jgi:hypothetical protein
MVIYLHTQRIMFDDEIYCVILRPIGRRRIRSSQSELGIDEFKLSSQEYGDLESQTGKMETTRLEVRKERSCWRRTNVFLIAQRGHVCIGIVLVFSLIILVASLYQISGNNPKTAKSATERWVVPGAA